VVVGSTKHCGPSWGLDMCVSADEFQAGRVDLGAETYPGQNFRARDFLSATEDGQRQS
jgi:hypothetical protein